MRCHDLCPEVGFFLNEKETSVALSFKKLEESSKKHLSDALWQFIAAEIKRALVPIGTLTLFRGLATVPPIRVQICPSSKM